MSLQNKAGTIILDATLTDIGRRYMANGKFEITKFALGDDEVDYAIGSTSGGEYAIDTAPPTFEAIASAPSAIINGLIDFGSRRDVLFMPEYDINTKVKNSVKQRDGVTYLSVNKETTEKLSSAISFNDYILENEAEKSNMLVFESGIAHSSIEPSATSVQGTEESKRRFLYNLKLHDQYAFVYVDSRFFNNIMTAAQSDSYIAVGNTGAEKSNVQPLMRKHKVSIPAPASNYDTYYCNTVANQIYDGVYDINSQDFSTFKGPRNCFVTLNFVVNEKMRAKSNGVSDVRFTKFGKTGQNLFSDGNLYDYVDTNIMVEGASTTLTKVTTIRIIRFSGT